MLDASDDLGAYTFRVMWSSSRGKTAGAKLQWWDNDCARPNVTTVLATDSTYTADDLCAAPANAWG